MENRTALSETSNPITFQPGTYIVREGAIVYNVLNYHNKSDDHEKDHLRRKAGLILVFEVEHHNMKNGSLVLRFVTADGTISRGVFFKREIEMLEKIG